MLGIAPPELRDFQPVFLGSLLFRDKRSEEMWDELYVRQNTGIHAEGAMAH